MLRDIGVGVAVLVKNQEEEVLLLKRKNKLGNGCWSTPGGHLETNESIVHCAMRECQEEIGIKINEFTFLGVTNDIHQDENTHYISIWMMATIDKESVIIPEEREVAAYGWYNIDEFSEQLFLPFKELLHNKYLTTGITYSINTD